MKVQINTKDRAKDKEYPGLALLFEHRQDTAPRVQAKNKNKNQGQTSWKRSMCRAGGRDTQTKQNCFQKMHFHGSQAGAGNYFSRRKAGDTCGAAAHTTLML